MVNQISFTGREECLTSSLKKAKKPVTEFVAESAIIPDAAQKVKTSLEEVSSAKINEAYKAAHAPYLAVPNQKTAEQVVMDGQIIQ